MICGRILTDTSEIHRLSSLDVGIYAVAPSLGFLRLRLKFSSHLAPHFNLAKANNYLQNSPF